MKAKPAIILIIPNVNNTVNICGENINVGRLKTAAIMNRAASPNPMNAFGLSG